MVSINAAMPWVDDGGWYGSGVGVGIGSGGAGVGIQPELRSPAGRGGPWSATKFE
ncbi:MAG: hypothetical protein MZU95_13915 [Desulfomicrobium escambiense]|nr:hypothetical protein [Desulfomicrobium escambiense]